MAKTANINVRVDPDFKNKVEDLYSNFGLSLTDAINIFLHVSLMEGGLPFEVRQPRYNAETEAAMKEGLPPDEFASDRGGVRRLLLVDPRRIRRIHSLGPSLHRRD